MSKNTNHQNSQSWYWKDRNSSFGGYAGVFHTATKIKQLIPKSVIYCEPFSGLGRTVEIDKHRKIILNDMSEYSNQYCRKNFPNTTVTHEDFIECIKRWDSVDTFFLIDPPWFDREYKSNTNSYCNMKSKKYYEILHSIVENLLGNWFVLSKVHKPQTEIWNYNKIIVESNKNVLFGKKARTLITTNLRLIN